MTKNALSPATDLRAARAAAQRRIDNGALPDFPAASRDVRDGEWRVRDAGRGTPTGTVHVRALGPDGPDRLDNALADAGRRPCVHLTDLQTRNEARWWRELLHRAVATDATPANAIVLCLHVDTIQSAFELDEIAWELRDHAASLAWSPNAFLLSFIRAFHRYPEYVLPDRSELAIGAPFLRALGKHVMRLAEQRQLAADGFPVPSPDSRNPVEGADLLQIHKGKITADGVRSNLRIVLAYLQRGATVTLDDQEHDTASAGFALAQLWQWIHHATGVLDEGRKVDIALIEGMATDCGDRSAALHALLAGPAPPSIDDIG